MSAWRRLAAGPVRPRACMRRISRRRFLAAAGLVLGPLAARAQKPSRRPTVGILNPHAPPPAPDLEKSPLRVRMRELGWVDGETVDFVPAFGFGSEDRLPELAAELVRRNVDVIWAMGPEAAVAAARATRDIPIVFWGVAYPVEQELIDSVGRPGRNATGVAWYSNPEVDGKRLELLREIAPKAKRLAFLNVPTAAHKVSGGRADFPSSTNIAASRLGYEVQAFPVARREDFDGAFRGILDWGAQAMTVAGTALTVRERIGIVRFASQHRLPSAYTLRSFVEAGGLVSYAIDWRPTFAQTGDYIDRILRGAKPGDLPVTLPTGYEVAVNLKAAAALGLTIPESVLLRADWIIRQ
jgi:putative ABC transport system substrate-binding protein